MDAVLRAFRDQLRWVIDRVVQSVNALDAAHAAGRRYPLMSAFIEDCLSRGLDVCAGGARYNLTGCIVVGLPNVVNALAAIRYCVFEEKSVSMEELVAALRSDFEGHEDLHRKLLAAPKWGNDDSRVDDLSASVAEGLYSEMSSRTNPRGGRWQLALYSFVFNNDFGRVVGASADGRRAGRILTRNLNPSWGTDRKGPTAVLGSLRHIDFSLCPNGAALDLRFDPRPYASAMARRKFADFLKGFVDLKVMEMQITMADTETLLAAKKDPKMWPDLMVKVAGFSARFADLSEQEKDEIIQRSTQNLGR
jgi:formate C-acetyltransferase